MDGDQDEGDEGCGGCRSCGPAVSHSRGLKTAVPNWKPAVAVVGVPAGDAAIDQEAAEGDHEGLRPGGGSSRRPMDGSRCTTPARDDQQQGERPVDVVGDQQVDEDDPEQREDRADREVDAAGDDDEALADARRGRTGRSGWPYCARLTGDRKRGLRIATDGAPTRISSEKAEILLQHRHGLRCRSSAAPTASRSTLYFAELRRDPGSR